MIALERHKMKERYKIILKIGKIISGEKNIDRLLIQITEIAKDFLEADRCTLWIYNKKKDILWTKIAHSVEKIVIPAAKGVAGRAAYTKEVQNVIDAYNDFRFYPKIDKLTGYLTKTILAVPLVDHRENIIGVFQALNKKDGFFDEEDIEFMLLVGSLISSYIENSLLYNKLKKTQMKIINKLSTAAEFKDEETSNHTKRVGEFSALLADYYGLKREEVELLRFTAPMHDVGKIGIADNILLKPAALSNKEFEIMKKHSIIGYNLLKEENGEDDEFLNTAALIAIEHHERLNGSGYPYGKKGKEISIFGRIVAIADVFDALTSKRVYKEAWDFEKTRDYILSCRTDFFDPDLVDIFEDNFDKFVDIKLKYKD